MAKKKIDLDKYASWLFLRTEQYADNVRKHYATAVEELLDLSSNIRIGPNETFSFSDSKKLSPQANNVLRGLYSAVYNEIKNGVAAEWEYANLSCDALIESIFGKGLEEDNHFARWFSRNQEAMDAFFARKSAYGGLNLSQKVWKYTGDLKTEMELALSLSLGQGNSASTVSREVRKYLQEPEKLFRRIKIGIDENGNPLYKLSKAAKAYNPGRGVYRSSYKNAMRLTRTETNMAYKTAEQDRWQRLDFVVGYEIKTSNNHPEQDICDELKGKYPKDFVFKGWHPQCRCYAVPILAKEDEFVEMQKQILAGENPAVKSVNIIRRPHEQFYKWWDDNKERVETASSMPYWVQDNQDYINKKRKIRIKTDEEREAIRKKWAERSKKYQLITKMANNVLKVAQEYPEVDVTTLQLLIDKKKISDMNTEARNVAKQIAEIREDEKALSVLIPDVHEWKKQFSSSELHAVYDAVEKKIAQIENAPLDTYKYKSLLEQKKAMYDKEVKYVSDPDYLKPHKLYSTWMVSEAAYAQQLNKVIDAIEWENINKSLTTITEFKTKSKPYLNLVDILKNAVQNHDKSLAQQTIAKINIKRAELDKAALLRQRKKMGATSLSDIDEKEMDRILNIFNTETVETVDKRLRSQTEEIWATLSDEEKRILTKYTQTYSYLNEPLRGLPYYGSYTPNADHIHDLPILTSVLDKFKMQQNTVVRRGVNDYAIKELGYNLSNVKAGDIFVDKGFLSTAVHRERGFHMTYELIIYVPKGAKGFYVEPLSHYTDQLKFDYETNLWDGKSVETLGKEVEWIGQRGCQFKVVKKVGKTIYLQMIGQLQ
ncbi:MAG: hypothetical protein J6U85_03645 [Bacteroidales bacterium]|nr:hypothetical protein [Bacteroidales bacterium]